MHPTIAKLQAATLKKIPEVKTGYTVRVSQKVIEGTKERIQHFEGLVIKVSHGAGVEKTFTVRKIVEGIGVEKIFPFHSPVITKIHVSKKAKVRREKLYYMRGLSGKSARLSEKHVTDEDRAAEEAKMSALYDEAIVADEKKQEAAEEGVEMITVNEADEEISTSKEVTEQKNETVETISEPSEEKNIKTEEANEKKES